MTKILRKTCSSLVKIISDVENNFTQNKYNKLQKISAKNKFFFCKYGITGSALVWHPEGRKIDRGSLSAVTLRRFAAQPALQCAVRGAQGVLPCVGWGVRPVNWIYRL